MSNKLNNLKQNIVKTQKQTKEDITISIIDFDSLILRVRDSLGEQFTNKEREQAFSILLPDVIDEAVRCSDCDNLIVKDGHVFVPFDVIRETLDAVSYYRLGIYRYLGWIDKELATYQHTTGQGFETVSTPIDDLTCVECHQDDINALKPNKDLLTEEFNQLPEGDEFDVRDILPDDFAKSELKIEIPSYAFTPDQWSKAFLRGLSKVDVADKKLLEVGVGTGINVIYLLEKSPESIAFSDKDERCVPLTCRNIRKSLPQDQVGKIIPYDGSLDAADWVGAAEDNNFDIAYGCLPQVELPDGKHITEDDAISHYYEKDCYKSDFALYGLSLNDNFLQQIHPHINKEGSVVLNLSGRPGQEILEQLFRKNGFEPVLLHKEVIHQHIDTSLESLAALESSIGRPFEFFEDGGATKLITATQAEERRKSGLPVFHQIYVYQGNKIS